jgi:CheY-like chemotaxis protein
MSTEYLNYIAGVSRNKKLDRMKIKINNYGKDTMRFAQDIDNCQDKKSDNFSSEETSFPNNEKSLLIAESDPNVLSMLNLYLNAMGYSFEFVTNGLMVLDKIRYENMKGKKKYDVIILDTHLDKLPGLNVAKEIHKKDSSQRIMIMSSSQKRQLNVNLLIEAQVKEQDIFTKPFRLSELLCSIERS